jgi:putative ABC transport system permease protein
VRARLRDVLLRSAAEREMEEELRFHVDMETEKNLRAGLPPAEARRRALAAFGGLERHRERLRDGRRLPLLEPLWHDLRFGARALARSPMLSLVAAVTVALGVGATTTVFSAANAILLRPLPLPEPDRLATIQERRSGLVSTGLEGMLIPYTRYQDYRDATRDLFESLAAFRLVDGFSLRLPDVTVSVNGSLTSSNYFQTLGVRPELGRAYASDDAPEIVLSHTLWATRFGGDPSAVGTSVGLDGRTVTVVGVAPQGFAGATFVADQMWVPVGLRGLDPGSWALRMVPLAKLRPAVDRPQAAAAVDALARRLVPIRDDATVRGALLTRVTTVPDDGRGMVTGFLGLLLATAVLVLLIAAANIAAIMVARGIARRREMAVRLALGAGRSRLVRHLMAESLMVFGLGGAAGVGLAYLGCAWLQGIDLPPQVPPLGLGFSPDTRVVAFAVGVTAAVGLLFGLLPALGASRPDLVPALKTGVSGRAERRGPARDLFVGAQIALAATLLLTAALFVRSVRAGLRADLGFDANGVVATTIDLGAPHDYDRDSGRAFNGELLERVRALPGVDAAGLSEYVLLAGARSGGGVRPEEAPDMPATYASYSVVTREYLVTMGIEILEGRGFTDADGEGATPVAVINRTLADRLWPGESPIGRRFIGLRREPLEVIGVTGPGRYVFVTEEPTGFAFLPYRQVYSARMNLHVRAPGAEAPTIRAIADVVRGLDPDVATGTPVVVRGVVGTGLFPQRFAAQLVGAFGIVGLVLAAMGIYGVLAYQVARRTRELGIRRALGATSRRVVRAVLGRGAVLAGAGCLIGTAAGAGLALAARSFLFGVRPLDPLTFSVVPLALFAVALLASWLPARRAASVEPSEALRTE